MSARKPPRPRFAVFASGSLPTPSTMAVDAAPRAGDRVRFMQALAALGAESCIMLPHDPVIEFLSAKSRT